LISRIYSLGTSHGDFGSVDSADTGFLSVVV
jgi:hypothetical protein